MILWSWIRPYGVQCLVGCLRSMCIFLVYHSNCWIDELPVLVSSPISFMFVALTTVWEIEGCSLHFHEKAWCVISHLISSIGYVLKRGYWTIIWSCMLIWLAGFICCILYRTYFQHKSSGYNYETISRWKYTVLVGIARYRLLCC